jgi:predicted RND superfamily exporter protein
MERFWRTIAVTLGKRWATVAVICGAITVLLGFGAARLEFATGQDSYLNQDSQIAIDNREFQSYFGGETVILLFTANDPNTDVSKLFEGQNLTTLTEITSDLEKIAEAQAVITPLTSMIFSDDLVTGAGANSLLRAPARDKAGEAVRDADVTVSLARRDTIPKADRVIGNPTWNELLIFANDNFSVVNDVPVAPPDNDRVIRLSLASTFPNPQTAVGGVVLRGNASLDEQSAGTEQVLDRLKDVTFEGFDLTVTGSPVYLKEINDYLKGGMVRLGIAAIAVMAVVLSLIFRVRWRLLPLAAVLLGVIWSFSLLGLIGIDLSLVTIAGLPILIGLGIDFAIQVHNRIEEEVLLDNDEHPIGETLANLAPPLLVATLTGVVAFLALRLSKVPMIRDFGVLLAIGIFVLVVTGIVVPASLLGIREYVDRSKGPREDNWIERLVVGLGSLPTKVAPILAVAGVGLFVGGILIEGRTRIESDPIRWIDQGSEVVSDINKLEDETGFSSTLGILVQANNVFDQQVIDLVNDFTIAAEQREEVVSTSSLVGTMTKILTVDGATVIPPSEQDVYEAATVMPPAIAGALVRYEDPAGTPGDNSDDVPTAAQVNLRLAAASLDERAVLVESLREDLQARIDALDIPDGSILLTELPAGQPPVRAVPAGLATVGIGLLENLESNRAALTYLALSLAGLYLVIRTRSLGRALLALVPVFLAIGVGALVVGVLGITLSPLTTVSGPLVVASVAEFSVLIMGRHIEERQAGLNPHDAVHTAARRTGRAFFTSALTIIGGFAVLISSSLPLLRDFGLIVTLNVTIALLAALVLMPPMLVWADERGMLHVAEQLGKAKAVRLAADLPSGATPYAAAGVLAFAGGVVATYTAADTSKGESVEVAYAATGTTTTSTTTTTLAPGETTVPIDPTSFPAERPTTPIAGLLYDRLLEQGVDGSAANCAITTAYKTASEDQLIAMGLANANPEALAIVTQGALACGIPQAAVDAAIAAQFGG